MSNQDSPTPPAPAEVCERLKKLVCWYQFRLDHMHDQEWIDDVREIIDTLTAAIAIISQGEKERERLAMAEVCLAEIRAMMPKEQEGVELPKCVFDMQQVLAAATERVKLWQSLAEEGATLAVRYGVSIEQEPFAEDLKRRVELAAREQPTPESK